MTDVGGRGRVRRLRARRAGALSAVGFAAVVAMVAGLLVGVVAAPAQAAPPDLVRDTPTGQVNGVAVSGGVTYTVGAFTSVGAATGGGSAVDSVTGVVNRKFPAIGAGAVFGVAADGSGGFYLCGSFLSVNGVPRTRLAHVFADGTLDPVWKPTASATVSTLTLSGSTVYLGGLFTTINGTVARNRAAAVDATTGNATTWDPNANGQVNALAVSGSTVYIGGAFTTVNSPAVTRNRAAAVDTTTGIATAWDPNVANNDVAALGVSGSTVYLGGSFTTINGATTRNRAAAVDATTGTATAWNPNLNGTVSALAVSGSTVYLGGAFTTINSPTVTRNRVAAVDATTGIATAWNPNASGVVSGLALSGSTVYLAGAFRGANSINGTLTRNRAAAVDTTTGTATAWDPNVANQLLRLAVSGSTVYLAGTQTHVNQVTRNRAAAFGPDGRLTAWDPNVGGAVDALAVSGSTVYLGGTFSGANSINGTLTRNRAAAVDATTGIATAWNPNLNGTVVALAVSGSTVYLGGAFSGANSINGTLTRNRAAAVDATTGIATAWDPNLNNELDALAVNGSTVYLGGNFSDANSINGTLTRNRAAAVDATTGIATTWNPNLSNGSVLALAVSGSTVYLGGTFSGANAINGTLTRNRAAAVDATTGTATAWNPNLNGTVVALAVSGSTVYLGGAFSGANSINGTLTRNRAAAVDATTGTATTWNPDLNNEVFALAVSGSTVSLGGTFTSTEANMTWPNGAYFASLALPGAQPSQVINPALTGSLLAWTPPLYGGIDKYYVMYRPVGSALPWAIYAAGANNSGVSLTNPGTRNTCSATNTAMGWTSCPMVRGWNPGTTYQFAIYPKTTEGKTTAGALTTQVTYLAP